MQFIDKDGQLQDGTPLTEEQVRVRKQILYFTHEKVCGGGYHSSYDRRMNVIKCEAVANFFITKFQLVPLDGTDMDKEIDSAVSENSPQSAPEIESPVSAA
jgi:hypothetical protein